VILTTLPGAGEQPLAFVTLSQIPYTGFKAGTLVASLYWLMLILWSAVIAYILLTQTIGARLLYALRHPFSTSVKGKEVDTIEKEEEESILQSITGEQMFSQNVNVPVFSLTGQEQERVATDSIVLETDANGRSPRLELKRTTGGGVIQKEDIKAPFKHYSVTSAVQHGVSNHVPKHVSIPKEEPAHHLASAVDIIRTVGQGNISQLLKIIQKYKSVQKDMSEVLIQTLCEFDRLYARRIGEHEPLKDESIEDIFENWKNKDIERLVHILSTGTDQNYLTQHTSAKIALLRAVEYAQEVRNHN